MRFTLMREAHADDLAAVCACGDAFTGIERFIHLGEKREGLVAVAKAGTLAESALIPMNESTMQQPGDGFAIGSVERSEVDGFAHGSEDFPAFAIALLDERIGCGQAFRLHRDGVPIDGFLRAQRENA